jgi:hypothetical protein
MFLRQWQLIQINSLAGFLNLHLNCLKVPNVRRLFCVDIKCRLPFWPPQWDRQIRFAERPIYIAVAGNDSSLGNRRPDCFNHCRICLRARQRRLVSIRLFQHTHSEEENGKGAAAQKKHWPEATDRHNPFPVSSEPIRRRRRRRRRFHKSGARL